MRLPSAQNVVLISIASVMDPSLAPRGKHTLHAYLPATEPWSLWEGALLPCLLTQLMREVDAQAGQPEGTLAPCCLGATACMQRQTLDSTGTALLNRHQASMHLL